MVSATRLRAVHVGQPGDAQKPREPHAGAVRAYLTDHEIDCAQLVSRGFGMVQPLVANDTEAQRAARRRVQFLRTESQTP